MVSATPWNGIGKTVIGCIGLNFNVSVHSLRMNKVTLFAMAMLMAVSLRAAENSGRNAPALKPSSSAVRLSSGQRLQWNYLQGLMRRLNETQDRDTREAIARDFLSGSSGLKELMAQNAEFWRGRAMMALMLDDAKAGREATGMYLRLVPEQESTGGLRTRLQQRGWVADGSQRSRLGGNFDLRALQLPMIYVEAGVFAMGCASVQDDLANEGPVTQVTLTKPFWMGKFEITRNQWQIVMGKDLNDLEQGALPMVGVTWDEAMKFCERLTTFERAANRLPEGYEYRLPTEAQWAYACRAGATGDLAEDLDQVAWYADNSDGRLHPTGQKKGNAWGLCNMQGNASEWCLDHYADRLPGGAQTDPTGPVEGSSRVVRGGNFASPAANCRITKRGGIRPEEVSNKIGLRVVLTQ